MAARLGKPVSNFERSYSDGTVRLSLELLSVARGAAERPALSAVNHLGDKSCYQTIRVITHECTYT